MDFFEIEMETMGKRNIVMFLSTQGQSHEYVNYYKYPLLCNKFRLSPSDIHLIIH